MKELLDVFTDILIYITQITEITYKDANVVVIVVILGPINIDFVLYRFEVL